jgi:SOS-response transcriptional repressor LexA
MNHPRDERMSAFRRAPRELGYRGAQVLALIRLSIADHGQAPSYTEIRNQLGFNDRADVGKVVKRLEGRGLIRRVGSGRVRRIRLPA